MKSYEGSDGKDENKIKFTNSTLKIPMLHKLIHLLIQQIFNAFHSILELVQEVRVQEVFIKLIYL